MGVVNNSAFEGWSVKGSALSPHNDDLFKVQIDELLEPDKQKRFHITRPDATVAAAVSRLTIRALPGKANKSDEEKLMRLLKRLSGARELGLTLGGDESDELNVQARSDASYGIHADAKSHAGLHLALDRGPIM